MKKGQLFTAVVGSAVISAFAIFVFRHDTNPIISGKPANYWISYLPSKADQGFADSSHPLEQAGPEIIPVLIRSIQRNYLSRRVYEWLWVRSPKALRSRLLERSAPESRIKCFAAFRLGQFGPIASNAVPILVLFYHQPVSDSFIKGRIIQALGNIGSPSRTAIPTLVEALGDTNSWVQLCAVESLLQIGEIPVEAVSRLQRQVQKEVYGRAAVAIWLADHKPESLDKILALLRPEADQRIRAYTARALAYANALPNEVLVSLQQMLDEPTASSREAAAIALTKHHAHDEADLISVLVSGIKQGEFQIPCAQSLGCIGPAARSAIPALKSALGNGGPVFDRTLRHAIDLVETEGSSQSPSL